MIFQLQELDRNSSSHLPDDCKNCGWWQGHEGGWPTVETAGNWIEAAEESFGGWGKLALGDDRLLGMIQYGPSNLFPRARKLACGPVSSDSLLLTCSAVDSGSLESVRKSLVLAVLGEMKMLEIDSVEAYSRQSSWPEHDCRLFEDKFLRDCGFYPVRASRGLQLMRFELGGTQKADVATEPRRTRHRILERIKRPSPKPVPAAMCSSYSAGRERTSTCS
ncbi:MAG: hypothetical protein WC828_05235 [Thermoleophilia bacterium]|jgi:hypothetical protein